MKTKHEGWIKMASHALRGLLLVLLAALLLTLLWQQDIPKYGYAPPFWVQHAKAIKLHGPGSYSRSIAVSNATELSQLKRCFGRAHPGAPPAASGRQIGWAFFRNLAEGNSVVALSETVWWNNKEWGWMHPNWLEFDQRIERPTRTAQPTSAGDVVTHAEPEK